MACRNYYYAAERKAPLDDRLLSLDWSDVVAATDTIATVTYADQDAVLTFGTPSIAEFVTSAQVAGGECGTAYNVDVQIVTTAGYTLNRIVCIAVREGGPDK